jgi:hypothetical protein
MYFYSYEITNDIHACRKKSFEIRVENSMLQPEAGIRIAVFAEGTRFFCGGIHLTHSLILCCSEDEHEENWDDSSLYILFNEEFGRKRFMDSHLKQSRQIMQSGTHDGKIKIPN